MDHTGPPVARAETARERTLASLRERIVAFAASRVTRDTAEDLAQEVLLVLHEKYAHLDKLEDLLPLSIRILRFKMMALHRKVQRRGENTQVSVDDVPLAGLDPDPETCARRTEMAARLAAAFRRMEPRCRELFRLKLEGRTFPEIQRLLGALSINTVYTWDSRCRKRLLEWMGGDWEARR